MINISARGFDLKQGAKDGIAKELRRVEKMLPQTAAFNVTLTREHSGDYQCDITVVDAGSFIRGEALADKIQPAIDMAVDDLKRKLRKLKTSLVDKQRKSGLDSLASAMEELAQESDWEDDQPSESIRRTKRVELMMMTDDEAIVQMEMLGHSFFVYLDEDGFTKVLNRRKNGYGVLICR